MTTPVFASMAQGPFEEGPSAYRRHSARRRTAPSCPDWVLALVIPYKGEAHLVDELDQLGATGSTRRAVRYLTSACKRYRQAGLYESLATMSDQSGIPVSTLRKALKWLRESGYLAEDQAIVNGRSVTMRWCLWLLPLGSTVAAEAPVFSGPRRALSGQKGAPFLGAKDRNRVNRERETTDRVDAGESSSSFSAPPPGTRAKDPGPMPSPIAAAIEAEVPDPADRVDLASSVPAWLASDYPIEWVVFAILEASAARLAKAGTAKAVHSLTAYAEGMLPDWKRNGRPSLRYSKAKLPPSGKTPELARADARAYVEAREAKARQGAEAERAELARTEALRLRWDSLPTDQRAEITARVEADNPHLRRLKHLREPLLLAAMAERLGK